MESIDLGVPLLFFVLIMWAFLAMAGILTTLWAKTKVGDRFKKLKGTFYAYFHKRHSH